MASSYRLTLESWLATLDVKAERVLDIGGSQQNVKGRTKSWDVQEYLIADLPEPHVGSPKPDIEIDLNFHMQDKIIFNEYDLIFCLEVFEYIWNPYQAFKTIEHMLSTNGTAWVTFPSQYPIHEPVEDDALRYMPAGIRKLAENTWLRVEEIIPRTSETNAYLNFCSAERLRAAKNQDHRAMGYIIKFKKWWR